MHIGFKLTLFVNVHDVCFRCANFVRERKIFYTNIKSSEILRIKLCGIEGKHFFHLANRKCIIHFIFFFSSQATSAKMFSKLSVSRFTKYQIKMHMNFKNRQQHPKTTKNKTTNNANLIGAKFPNLICIQNAPRKFTQNRFFVRSVSNES